MLGGWEELLTTINGLNKQASDHCVAVFWACWKQQLHQTQKAMAKGRKAHMVPTGNTAVGQYVGTPSTPQDDRGAKQKQEFTPGSTKPPTKQPSYVSAVGGSGDGSKPKSQFYSHFVGSLHWGGKGQYSWGIFP